MLARGVALLAAMASLIATSAPGQSVPGQSVPGQSAPGQSVPGQRAPGDGMPGSPPPVSAIPDDATSTDTALTLGALQNRMTVPVSIDDKGPWGFVIDTGAERTVVSRELASTLGLVAGPDLRVIAMTGPKVVPSVLIPALSVSTVRPTAVTAPALEEQNLGAPGMLGIDALQGHRVDIDFDKSSMMLRPSRRRYLTAGNHGDEIVVIARSMFGQLIVTDARWRGKRIAVVIDTGSMVTVGNPALLALMQGRSKYLGPTTAVSVTGARLDADIFVVDDLKIGSIGLDRVPIAFADAAPFHRFGLEKRPALMLGMETLRMFRHVRIDFANRAIEFTLPRASGLAVAAPPA